MAPGAPACGRTRAKTRADLTILIPLLCPPRKKRPAAFRERDGGPAVKSSHYCKHALIFSVSRNKLTVSPADLGNCECEAMGGRQKTGVESGLG